MAFDIIGKIYWQFLNLDLLIWNMSLLEYSKFIYTDYF